MSVSFLVLDLCIKKKLSGEQSISPSFIIIFFIDRITSFILYIEAKIIFGQRFSARTVEVGHSSDGYSKLSRYC